MFLTNVKDLDLKILQRLSDKDVKSISLVSKYGKRLYDDEIFWLNRLILILGLDLGEIRDIKGDFSYKEIYFFNKYKIKKSILEAVRRNNIHLFRKLWEDEDFKRYKYWEEILHEIGKYGNKDLVTYICAKENDPFQKYDIAGTIMYTANESFIEWLLKTGILAYDQYILCIFEHPKNFSLDSFPDISKYLSRIKDDDCYNIIHVIARYVDLDNLNIAKKILEILITFKHVSISKDYLKKQFVDHSSGLIDQNFIDNL